MIGFAGALWIEQAVAPDAAWAARAIGEEPHTEEAVEIRRVLPNAGAYPR